MNWFITGDCHGQTFRLTNFAKGKKQDTAIIILGDAGFNTNHKKMNKRAKNILEKSNIFYYLVRGNHEERPENLPNIETIYDEEVQNEVYIEPNYPHIRYFKDGFTYIINGYSTLVLGGAYSVDKKIQIARGGWFESEQLTEKEKAFIYTKIKGQDFDFILSHTCPISIEPTDLFLSCVTQSEVDKSMECWLEEVKNNCNWKIWCFGHFHADRLERPRMEMFYTDISPIEEIYERWKEKEDEVELDWWLEKSPQYYWD